MLETLGGEVPTNGGAETIIQSKPYVVNISIKGTSPLLFHRWNCESVEEKAKAKKGSEAKKTDNVESYVYRDDEGFICIPGEYLRMAIIGAAKFEQDPRSPRKSAMDMFKAGVVSLTELASMGTKEWDYLDKRRVTIQRNGVTRSRPAMKEGWQGTFSIQILLPEYINEGFLRQVLENAGRLIGIGDFRPTYGRFVIQDFEVI